MVNEEVKCVIASKANTIRVLHVDDDPCMLEVTKAILCSEGNYEVENAMSVDEAQEKLAVKHYDAIISDYEMPQKDGLQFLVELKRQNNPMPFILFTGKGREEVAIKALNLGADGYINKQGNPETVYGELAHSLQSAVARRQAENKAIESEHLLQKIVGSTPNLIYIYDLIEKKNVYANKEVTDFLGYTTDQIRAMGSQLFANILHPDDAAIVAAHHARFADAPDNAVFELEYRMKHSDGEWRWLHSRDVLFSRTKQGVGNQILGSCWDTTKQKQAELELRQRFELLERVGENIDSGLAIIDRNYRVVWANQVLHNAGAKAGRKCFECIARVNEVCADCGAKRVFEENLPLHVHDYKGTLPNGETNWVEIRVTPLKDKKGQIIAALELAVPINERKKYEEVLKESQEKFQTLADESPNMIFINKKGRIVYTNKKCQEIMGYTQKEFYSKDFSFLTLIAQESQDILKSAFCRHLKGEHVAPYEYKLVTKNRRVVEAQINTKLIDYEGDKAILGVVTDISVQQKLRNQISVKNELLENILNATDAPFFSIDKNYCYTDFNPSHRKVMKQLYGAEIQLEHNILDYITVKADRSTTKKNLERAFAGQKAIEEAFSGEKGLSRRYFLVAYNPVKNNTGEINQVVVVASDISDCKEAEERSTADRMQVEAVNEKLRVVGSLTRHDVGNKLAAIKSQTFLVKKQIGNDPKLIERLENIDSLVDKCVELFEVSRIFEQLGHEKLSKVSLAKSFDEAVKLHAKKEIEFTNTCQYVSVLADSLLQQLFYQLIDNSVKHGKNVTKIRVSCIQDDDGTTVIYEDNGAGIPHENKKKIFTEGFTTGGSGLGLKLVKKMIDVYGWTIKEDGKPGEGARFVMTIPRDQNLDLGSLEPTN